MTVADKKWYCCCSKELRHMINDFKEPILNKLTTALGPQTDWEGYWIRLALEVPTEEKKSSLPRIWDNIITRKYTFIIVLFVLIRNLSYPYISEINHSLSSFEWYFIIYNFNNILQYIICSYVFGSFAHQDW